MTVLSIRVTENEREALKKKAGSTALSTYARQELLGTDAKACGKCTDFVLQGLQEALMPQLQQGRHDSDLVFASVKMYKKLLKQRLFLPTYSPDLNPVAKRTRGHLNNSALNSKPGCVKWYTPYFLYSNCLTPSFKTLINYEADYSQNVSSANSNGLK